MSMVNSVTFNKTAPKTKKTTTNTEPVSEHRTTCNLSANIWPQLSQLTEQLWTKPGIKSGISVRQLIFTSNKNNKKSASRKRMVEHSSKILTSEEKDTTTIWTPQNTSSKKKKKKKKGCPPVACIPPFQARLVTNVWRYATEPILFKTGHGSLDTCVYLCSASFEIKGLCSILNEKANLKFLPLTSLHCGSKSTSST